MEQEEEDPPPTGEIYSKDGVTFPGVPLHPYVGRCFAVHRLKGLSLGAQGACVPPAHPHHRL